MPRLTNSEIYDTIIDHLDAEKKVAEQLDGHYNVSYYKGLVDGITFMMELFGLAKHGDIIERHYREALNNVNAQT